MGKPLITFCAMAHNEEHYNMAFLNSMQNQTCDNWKAIIYHNGPNEELSGVDNRDDRFVYMETEEDNGQWGTINRQHCIDICDTEFIVQTSIQDFFIPTAVEELMNVIEQKPDIITYPALNHLFRYDVVPGQIELGKIDWGQVCIKTSISKQIGINRGSEFCADYYFFKECQDAGLLKTRIHINKILTIHN